MAYTPQIPVSALARKPSWVRIPAPNTKQVSRLRHALNLQKLHTVCQEARCPNLNECWSQGTATIMILGRVCTRGCRFCSVQSGNPKGELDRDEPRRVAAQIASTNLEYVVITCVDRDDLCDGGSGIFAETIREVKKQSPGIRVEALISDYGGNEASLDNVIDTEVDVLAHNLETVRGFTRRVRDPRAGYDQSLKVLRYIKEQRPNLLTKSSLMVGFGETFDELTAACEDLKQAGVDVVTFGQYLRPTSRHIAVKTFYPPEAFRALEEVARRMGFLYVASGPLVRSSYRAAELFLKGHLDKGPMRPKLN